MKKFKSFKVPKLNANFGTNDKSAQGKAGDGKDIIAE
jgi:hypothetical protein